MLFHNQLVKHNPPESYGDCVRTCLACLLDMNPLDVPNSFHGEMDTQKSWEWIEDWLNNQGYCTLVLHVAGPIEAFHSWMAEFNPGVLHIILGDNHAVIGCDGKILHDPSWTKQSVKNPTHVLILLPLTMRYTDK